VRKLARRFATLHEIFRWHWLRSAIQSLRSPKVVSRAILGKMSFSLLSLSPF
jgi:hypothetical protein